jgi:uncharacterized membrane protein YkvA (DUF1232 family)
MTDHAFAGDDGAARAGFAWRERLVRSRLLPKLKRGIAQIPFAEDLLAAYYAMLDRRTPFAVRATLLGALAYFVLPTDIIPDFLAGIGFTDDAAVLYAALRSVAGAIEPRHRDAARTWLDALARSAEPRR